MGLLVSLAPVDGGGIWGGAGAVLRWCCSRLCGLYVS